jgi:predicted ATP-grasp superfamily ATP-dependent carboligase
VTGSATDEELVERLGLSASRYEGPTGIVGVLHDVCRQRGIASASLWAAVPHYVSLTPSPRGALALCERLGTLIGATVDGDELEEAARSYEEQVSEAVASDERLPPTSRSSSAAPTSSKRQRTCRRATRSPPS